MTGVISILAALHAAREEGRGQHIEIAMIDAVAYYLMGDTLGNNTYLPHKPGLQAGQGQSDPFKTADGYIAIAPLTDKHWDALLKGVGHPEWFDGEDSRSEKVRKSIWKIIELFPSKPSALLARDYREGRRAMRYGQRLRHHLERSAIRRERDFSSNTSIPRPARCARCDRRRDFRRPSRNCGGMRRSSASIPMRFSATSVFRRTRSRGFEIGASRALATPSFELAGPFA